MVLAHSNVEFVGEIGKRDKAKFLGEAAALLFPIDWPEPFGLVMIEAMACGTPVIAFRRGSVPEVLKDGTSGLIVDTIEEAVAATRRIASLDRAKVRAEFERRFTVERMALDYLEIYRDLTATRTKSAPARRLICAEKDLPAVPGFAVELLPATATPTARRLSAMRGNATNRIW